MKCKLLEGSHMVIQETEYRAGDIVDLDKEFAQVQIQVGIVEEFKPTKKGKE